jgi:predicted enzyme related to lactoylglutathione lyase
MQVIFAVNDLQRSLDFYEQAFDWPRNERIDYSNYVELHPTDGGTLGLYERDGYAATVGATATETPEDRVAPAYVYVRVEDVDAATARIEAAGGRPLSPLSARSWGETAAWFADPDGNVVAVAASS